MIRRHELPDDEWTVQEPLLRRQKPPIGKPNLPYRTVLRGANTAYRPLDFQSLRSRKGDSSYLG
jgi:hypothetical protein